MLHRGRGLSARGRKDQIRVARRTSCSACAAARDAGQKMDSRRLGRTLRSTPPMIDFTIAVKVEFSDSLFLKNSLSGSEGATMVGASRGSFSEMWSGLKISTLTAMVRSAHGRGSAPIADWPEFKDGRRGMGEVHVGRADHRWTQTLIFGHGSNIGWHALRYSEGRVAAEPRPSEYLRACHPNRMRLHGSRRRPTTPPNPILEPLNSRRSERNPAHDATPSGLSRWRFSAPPLF